MKFLTKFALCTAVSVGVSLLITKKQEEGFDPDFCEKKCPICVPARNGNAVCQQLQAVEMAVTGGGCPWGRARQEKYGVLPIEKIPE